MARFALMRFDWKDSLLACGGMIVAVALISVLRTALGLGEEDSELVGGTTVLVMLGPVMARRAVFGNPKLPAPRASPLASLASIVGLLATLSGMLLLLLAASSLPEALASPPDFEAQVRAQDAQVDAMLAGLPREPKDEGTERLDLAQARSQWAAKHEERQARVVKVAGSGLLLVLLGALAAWWRYPPPDADGQPSRGGLKS